MPPEARTIGAQHWNLRLLGECGLRAADGAPIPLSTRKSLGVLAYLARQPERRATRERLAALLWEDAAPAQARLNLRKALSSLRQETRLPDAPAAILIEANNDAVWLTPGALASDAEALEAALPALPGAATVAELYAGDFLSDLALRAAPAFEAWAQIERQRLRETAIASLTALMEQALQPGASPAAGVVAAMRVLALDPLQERAHRALMRLYVRQGRPAAALKQFHALSELLARELHTAPEAESRDLFREISSARHARGPEGGRSEHASAPPLPAQAAPRGRTSIAAAAMFGLAAVVGGWAYLNRSPA